MTRQLTSSPWLVDGIFPAYEVHMIAGPSGSGKTTLLAQMVDDWAGGKEVFGRHSHPCTFSYYSLDRSLPGVYRTFDRCAPNVQMTINSLLKLPPLAGIGDFLKRCFETHPESDVFIIDGIARLVMGGKLNDYKVVADFLGEACATCQQFRKTVFGVVHSPKMKEGERYLSPRQRVLGSGAWAAYCETILVIEPPGESGEGEGATNRRDLTIYPRQGDEIRLKLQFNSLGRLEEVPEESLESCLGLLEQMPKGVDLERSEILQLSQSLGIPQRTVDRMLRRYLENGEITKPMYGKYRRM